MPTASHFQGIGLRYSERAASAETNQEIFQNRRQHENVSTSEAPNPLERVTHQFETFTVFAILSITLHFVLPARVSRLRHACLVRSSWYHTEYRHRPLHTEPENGLIALSFLARKKYLLTSRLKIWFMRRRFTYYRSILRLGTGRPQEGVKLIKVQAL